MWSLSMSKDGKKELDGRETAGWEPEEIKKGVHTGAA